VLRSACTLGRGVYEDTGRDKGARLPTYTQIYRRRKEPDIHLGVEYDNDKPGDIVVDSTGIKAFKRGEWMTRKWGVGGG